MVLDVPNPSQSLLNALASHFRAGLGLALLVKSVALLSEVSKCHFRAGLGLAPLVKSVAPLVR
jgi:hypothetical protein